MTDSLYGRLKKYGNSDFYPFHMPGHKRNFPEGNMPAWYSMDITEIDGFDNLHQPQGILLESQKKAAELYCSDETFFLVNGSTAGILCAISATAKRGKKILVSRNSHMSVYHGVYLNNIELEYLYPEIGADGIATGITAEMVAEQIEEREDIGMVILNSPSYEGVISDIKGIAEVVHRKKIPLIVDAAHGAHFGFHPGYPENAVRLGADLVIHSLHKTLPAPTQTALLHVNGQLIDRRAVRRWLRVFQTSSPSYPLMGGIDFCIGLLRDKGRALMEDLLHMRAAFDNRIKECKYIKICDRIDDPVKAVIFVPHFHHMNGCRLAEMLRHDFHLEVEMASSNYVIAIFTIMDKPEGINRLAEAICEIDRRLDKGEKADIATADTAIADIAIADTAITDSAIADSETANAELRKQQVRSMKYQNYHLDTVMSIREAMDSVTEVIELETAADRVATEFISLYPPGIPIAVPGERLDDTVLKVVGEYRRQGLTVHGLTPAGGVSVIKNQGVTDMFQDKIIEVQ